MIIPSERLAAYLRGKKILILGFGREGRSTYDLFTRIMTGADLTIADRNPVTTPDPSVRVISGEDYLSCLGGFDVVVKTPGIAFLGGVSWPETTEITCQTDLFLRFCRCDTVGITGTKGKTTTSTLTYEMLVRSGRDAVLCGNIGIPVLDSIDLPETSVAVTELSCHQLEFTSASPRVAVVTNLFEEHLDHYRDGFAGYVRAKANITAHQGPDGIFIYDRDSAVSGRAEFSASPAQRRPVAWQQLPEPLAAACDGNHNIRGDRERMDVMLAWTAASAAGADISGACAAAAAFKGIEHRLEFVGNIGGIDYYNDSIATIPAASENAVKSVPNAATLIIGGLDRGIDYSDFIAFLASSRLQNIICMPDTGIKIGRALEEAGAPAGIYYAPDMQSAVALAGAHTPSGGACILSPAAASYNAYKNFEEKGKEYKRLVLSK